MINSPENKVNTVQVVKIENSTEKFFRGLGKIEYMKFSKLKIWRKKLKRYFLE